MNDLCSTALSDQEFQGIIICLILSMDNWMPILLSLYSLPTLSDIISHIQTHATILCAVGKGPTQSHALAARSHTHTCGCGNSGCKACDKTKHTTENCYWLGRGKGGTVSPQFWAISVVPLRPMLVVGVWLIMSGTLFLPHVLL